MIKPLKIIVVSLLFASLSGCFGGGSSVKSDDSSQEQAKDNLASKLSPLELYIGQWHSNKYGTGGKSLELIPSGKKYLTVSKTYTSNGSLSALSVFNDFMLGPEGARKKDALNNIPNSFNKNEILKEGYSAVVVSKVSGDKDRATVEFFFIKEDTEITAEKVFNSITSPSLMQAEFTYNWLNTEYGNKFEEPVFEMVLQKGASKEFLTRTEYFDKFFEKKMNESFYNNNNSRIDLMYKNTLSSLDSGNILFYKPFLNGYVDQIIIKKDMQGIEKVQKALMFYKNNVSNKRVVSILDSNLVKIEKFQALN